MPGTTRSFNEPALSARQGTIALITQFVRQPTRQSARKPPGPDRGCNILIPAMLLPPN